MMLIAYGDERPMGHVITFRINYTQLSARFCPAALVQAIMPLLRARFAGSAAPYRNPSGRRCFGLAGRVTCDRTSPKEAPRS
jgi:hypothetical protein